MDEKLIQMRSLLLRAHNRAVNSESIYEQGEAEGLSFALDVFDSYFGEVK